MNKLDFWARVAVIALSLVVLFGALDVAQNLVAPILLALVVGVVLSPIPNTLDKFGLPKSLAALSSLLIIMLIVAALVLFLQPSFKRLADALPFAVEEINGVVIELRNEFRGLEDAGKDVAEALNDDGDGTPAPEEPETEEDVTDSIPTVEDALILAPSLMSQAMIFIGVLFFFMLTRDEVYAWIARRLAPDELKLEVAHRLRMAEKQVGRYFLTITIINSGYAVVVSVAMIIMGMPSPILWGIGAGLLNYILYLGPAIMAGTLFVAGLVVFDGPYSMAPMGVYVLINVLESQFVSPAVVGRAMQVNPLLIFLALIFFLWLWGPVGGVIAIPLLLWVMVLSADIREVRAMQADLKPSELKQA